MAATRVAAMVATGVVVAAGVALSMFCRRLGGRGSVAAAKAAGMAGSGAQWLGATHHRAGIR